MSRIITAFISLAILALSGCITGRPHTQAEKNMLVHAIVGQSIDCATTDYALKHGFHEGNQVWWTEEDIGGMIASKTAMIGIAYLIGQYKPDWRIPMYGSLGGSGYVAGTWNAGVIILGD